MSERLVIIDGKSVLYRGYYAMPNLSTKDGAPTGGVYGFAVMALEVIRRLKPDYVCVAWDKRGTNVRKRRELYPDYKGNRKAAPEDFYDQVAILHQLLDSLGWPLYELDDYEADDIMGAFAEQAKAKDIESFLVTSDLDVLQLVNSHTHIYTLKKGLSNIELFDVAHFEEKYGVGAHQWVDVKALKGDSSDNVPGVAGVGEKTALELISKYETIDGVYAHLDELKPALKAKLEKDKDIAYLSKELVTLYVDAPITLDFNKARLGATVPPSFVAMLRKLEFRNLLRQVEAQATTAQLLEVEEQNSGAPEPAKEVPLDAAKYASGKPRMAVLDANSASVWVSLKPGEFSILSLEDAAAALNGGQLIGHDLKALYRAMLAVDKPVESVVEHDTRIAAFVLNAIERSFELSDLAGYTIAPDDAGQTMAAVWQLYREQTRAFQAVPKLHKVATQLDFPMIPLLAKIEHRGILLDSQYLAKMSGEFETRIATLEQQIHKEAGKEFNIGSPVQLGAILYEELGLPTQGVKKGKTGYSTGAAELDKLRGLHPIVNLITEYREYTKLKNTYIDALPKLVDMQGRLHTTFALDVAATGRLSSRDPNLQNIPTRTELGQAIRVAFVPAPGNVFVSADYSQFELRLAAAMANDAQMIQDFNSDIDIHTATAAQVAGVPLDQVDKEMRRRAKAVNFGILYGMSPHGLSVATGMTLVEARDFIAKYFEFRKPLQDYMNHTAELALKQGYVETLLGRRRPTPDMKSSNWVVREAAKRAAINMPIQGTEADIMKLAMLAVEDKLAGLGEQLLQIHDSILVECPADNAAEVARILKETMETVYQLPVKLRADVKQGKNWGEL
jgi:DNA polymerase-1